MPQGTRQASTQHQKQEHREQHHHHDSHHLDQPRIRSRGLSGATAGLAVDQKAVDFILIAVGHDPDRQQYWFAGQIVDPEVDLDVPVTAWDALRCDRFPLFLL